MYSGSAEADLSLGIFVQGRKWCASQRQYYATELRYENDGLEGGDGVAHSNTSMSFRELIVCGKETSIVPSPKPNSEYVVFLPHPEL